MAQAGQAGRSDLVEGRRITIRGTVQGVGFRPWVFRLAQRAGISGRVLNDAAGVTILAFGAPGQIAMFLALLQTPSPPAARVTRIETATIPPEPLDSFVIVESERGDERRVSIPPDLTICDRCAAEIADPADRRFRYAFTNCTNCGPRFTIATDVPYDRHATTMAPFRMCPACEREYGDVADRRFHAQPNACAVCGPRVKLYAPDGEVIPETDPIRAAASALRDGQIVAVKGIGGFHLACDATSVDAVARLRERKRREAKPLAVMVASIDAAHAVAVLDEQHIRLLTSPERPIVLAERRQGSGIADNVAPRNKQIGLLLVYSPLHQLLLADAQRPLVMTSGNVSDEPIASTNDEAVRRLGSIADLLLMHDRSIENRCDDSVAAIIHGEPVILRRSRGFVPRPIHVRRAFARPVLACGALLKNTFCLGAADNAWLGPHIGDLENLETFEAYTESISRLERFLDLRPEVIAHDLHPDYLSTVYARRRPERIKVPVQHHHAHVVSAMAEHGLVTADDRAIGIAYDGTGCGTDGTSWGSEVLLATTCSFSRIATFRPIPLVGGDRAVHEPWRIALAVLDDAFDGAAPSDAMELLSDIAAGELQLARELLSRRINTPLARGIGRYFDAFGALFLSRAIARFEGQVALEWDQAAADSGAGSLPFELRDSGGLIEVDLRPAVRSAVARRVAGDDVAVLSAAFHATLVEATAELVRRAIRVHGNLPVVASGGCFQNKHLAEGLAAALAPAVNVQMHRDIPPGDGGISLGQAIVADAISRA